MEKFLEECLCEPGERDDAERAHKSVAILSRMIRRRADEAINAALEVAMLEERIDSARGDGDEAYAKRAEERLKNLKFHQARSIFETANACRALARVASRNFVIDQTVKVEGLVESQVEVITGVTDPHSWVWGL